MPARATGSVYRKGDGSWAARMRTHDGRRVSVDLPDCTDEAAARREAAALSRVARERRRAAVAAPSPPRAGASVGEWIGRWFDGREARGLQSVEADRPRWSKWVAPALGGLDMAAVSTVDIETLVERLDASIAAGDVSWKTIANVWTLVRCAFRDACRAKNRAMRVRTDDPTAGVRGPERGGRPAKSVLFPAEALRFFRCPDVPIDLRRAVAVGIYTGMRPGELRALTWAHVDMEQGTILVHEQVDRQGARRATKTKRTRRIPIEPHLMPLLAVMRAASGGTGPVLRYQLKKHTPRVLRAALRRAGVTRKELHDTKSATLVAVRVHDTRGTFCTWAAARGDGVLRIAAVAGHESIQTTQVYVQAGELLRDALRDAFPPLPDELLTRPGDVDTNGHGLDTGGANPAKSLWVDRDSNPGESAAIPGGSAGDCGRGASANRRTPTSGHGTQAATGHVVDAIGELLDAGDVVGAQRIAAAYRGGRG